MSAVPNVPETVHAEHESPADAALQHLLRTKQAATNGLERVDSRVANGVVNGVAPEWSVHDTPIENQRPIRVIVIGAGYSGIYLGIRIPERLRNCELVIYEKNKGVGGAWCVFSRNHLIRNYITPSDHMTGMKIDTRALHAMFPLIRTNSLSTPNTTGPRCTLLPTKSAATWRPRRRSTASTASRNSSTKSPIADGTRQRANGM